MEILKPGFPQQLGKASPTTLGFPTSPHRSGDDHHQLNLLTEGVGQIRRSKVGHTGWTKPGSARPSRLHPFRRRGNRRSTCPGNHPLPARRSHLRWILGRHTLPDRKRPGSGNLLSSDACPGRKGLEQGFLREEGSGSLRGNIAATWSAGNRFAAREPVDFVRHRFLRSRPDEHLDGDGDARHTGWNGALPQMRRGGAKRRGGVDREQPPRLRLWRIHPSLGRRGV